jgi:hypothetical protein
MEVYLHNPWLTYGIGLHRLREAGLGTNLMDLLDEKAFDLNQIHAWCTEFFRGNQDSRIRHPNIDWSGFLADLQGLLKREKLVWNSVKNKLCPWIDLEKLDSMYRRQSGINLGCMKDQQRQGAAFERVIPCLCEIEGLQ